MNTVDITITNAQADALATLLAATGGNSDLDALYDALTARGFDDSGTVTFEVNDLADEFPGTSEFNIIVEV